VSLALQSLLDAGLVREAAGDPGRPSYGAVFFEPVPEAAFVVGVDLGARFLRGAVCDVNGTVRVRRDVERTGADVEAALTQIEALLETLTSSDVPGDRVDGVVVGVPGVVDAHSGRLDLADNVPGLGGMAFGPELERRLGLRVHVENDINLAALGERWRGVAHGVDDFAFLSVGTGLGAGLVLRGELHRGRHGAAGEVDFVSAGTELDIDPSAPAVTRLAEQIATNSAGATALAAPFDVPAVFAEARRGDAAARAVVTEEARRIARHIVPIAAVADVALVVVGGGLSANGDLLLPPVRSLLERWLPYPPRVEPSSLGEAAVLTGALSLGVRDALDNVFANRQPAP
jgi:predicted NBD/HSP70 family sugar kinase